MPAVGFGGKPPHFVPKTAIFHGLRDFFVPFCPVSRSFSASIFPICRKAAVIPPRDATRTRRPPAKNAQLCHEKPRFFAKNSPFFPDAPPVLVTPRAVCLLSVRRRIEVPQGASIAPDGERKAGRKTAPEPVQRRKSTCRLTFCARNLLLFIEKM